MLFYFTGTGNSLYTAKRLAESGEKLIDMADAVRNGKFSYLIPDNENVGFVFPVYFYSVPDIVEEFCRKLKLKNAGYVYAVITCGASTGGSGGHLGEILSKRNIELANVYDIVMPDNAMLFYNIADKKKNLETLKKADKTLDTIKNRISAKEKGRIRSAFTGRIGRSAYAFFRKTKKFYADNSCVGCGLCAKNCPVGAIRMKNSRPQWIKESCSKCTACINRCPSGAIQYGRSIVKRNRYVNPILRGDRRG